MFQIFGIFHEEFFVFCLVLARMKRTRLNPRLRKAAIFPDAKHMFLRLPKNKALNLILSKLGNFRYAQIKVAVHGVRIFGTFFGSLLTSDFFDLKMGV